MESTVYLPVNFHLHLLLLGLAFCFIECPPGCLVRSCARVCPFAGQSACGYFEHAIQSRLCMPLASPLPPRLPPLLAASPCFSWIAFYLWEIVHPFRCPSTITQHHFQGLIRLGCHAVLPCCALLFVCGLACSAHASEWRSTYICTRNMTANCPCSTLVYVQPFLRLQRGFKQTIVMQPCALAR